MMEIKDMGETNTQMYVKFKDIGGLIPKEKSTLAGYFKDAKRIIDEQSDTFNALRMHILLVCMNIIVGEKHYYGDPDISEELNINSLVDDLHKMMEKSNE